MHKTCQCFMKCLNEPIWKVHTLGYVSCEHVIWGETGEMDNFTVAQKISNTFNLVKPYT